MKFSTPVDGPLACAGSCQLDLHVRGGVPRGAAGYTAQIEPFKPRDGLRYPASYCEATNKHTEIDNTPQPPRGLKRPAACWKARG